LVVVIRRALVSVSDKSGIQEFARALSEMGVEIVSTGGTARTLREAGIPVREISEMTGFPEMMDGRVKTLHPKIHAGILALRDNPAHLEQMARHGISPIDLVVVNLYPFEEAVRRDASFDEVVEQIDIGGPALVRAAAKNHAHVAVVVDPSDYAAVLAEMRESGGALSERTRFRLAAKAFGATARYDGAISSYLGALDDGKKPRSWSDALNFQLVKLKDLRYGENPQQRAAFYTVAGAEGPSIARARQLQGKELSFNNILDADAALGAVLEFSETAAVVIKHTNPCGAAISRISLADAFRKARASDPVSIFGGVVAFNRPVDAETARELKEIFLEIVVAPGFSAEAREMLASSKRLLNLRLLEVDLGAAGEPGFDLRRVRGGVLVQDWDRARVDVRSCRVATRRRPTEAEYAALSMAWRVCRHVKSNAIVFASPEQVLGVGAGQMSRVDSARLAVMRAKANGLELKGSAVASDGFYPFRDGVDEAARAGATAVIQPGGSIKDDEVIAAADEHGMAMLLTGVRHFRH
jgi:phosphoribosylaminoimidazolecarboxamide formyltransferase/IMP cyclohydrolase